MAVTRQTTRAAYELARAVRITFKDNREKYDTFVKVMMDFKANRISHGDVRSRVKDLFKGHQELILAFNKFMPKGYKITLESDQSLLKDPKFEEEALVFINKVKARLQNNRAHRSFLKILHMYTQDKKSVTEVFLEVFDVIFRDHQDLRLEFVYFLPRYKRYYRKG